MKLEFIVNSVELAEKVVTGGADRIEFCKCIELGGITPIREKILQCRDNINIPISMMVRPRGGDFFYSEDDFIKMRKSIKMAKEIGINCVVFGILKLPGNIDYDRCRTLIDDAYPMEICFHRAFDLIDDPYEAINQLVLIGVDRIMTSGKKKFAVDGIDQINKMGVYSSNRISIMPGGGINSKNLAKLVFLNNNINEIHINLFSSNIKTNKNDEKHEFITNQVKYCKAFFKKHKK
jgi:copper homeostasis protein